jgi:uncharacterized protein YndB with AHSA1/START domain
VTAPLLTSFDVACSAEHAFHVWTDRIGTWWPSDHTATGQADLIVLEGGVGGRIYERTSDGVEHDWGEVTVWEPPARLVYLWHLRRDRTDATRERNRAGWQSLLPHYLAEIDRRATTGKEGSR